jgi:Holliday junction DNA helicase RuvA
MIYSIKGIVQTKTPQFAVVEVGGLGIKVFASSRCLRDLPTGEVVNLYSHLVVKEDALDLYGFTSLEEMDLFELLIGISGVGPRSALAVLDVAELKDLCAAIQEGRADLLTQASGIGRKTAERIILELKGKVVALEGDKVVKRMDSDADLIETLTSLGYRREQAKAAVSHVDQSVVGLEARLKAALKVLGRG